MSKGPVLHRAYRGTIPGVNGEAPSPKANRLAVLPDPDRTHPLQYAIVTRRPIHDRHEMVGYQRGYGERHWGLYAYRFTNWMTAARVAHIIAEDPHPFDDHEDCCK